MDLEDCEIDQNINKFIDSLFKLFYCIKKINVINNILGIYISDIYIKISELRKLSDDDKTRNIELAMRVLEILDIE